MAAIDSDPPSTMAISQTPFPAVSSRARHARFIAAFAWAALTALQIIWHGFWMPSASMPMTQLLAVTTIPLLLPLLALPRLPRALLWAGVLALLYLCHGVMEAWAVPAHRIPALLEVAFSLILVGALGPALPKPPKADPTD